MAWYVFALVDGVPGGPPGKGLRGNLSIKRVPGGLAVVERRADVPPAEFGTLQRHQAVVERLAGAVSSILPVRFGTLLEDAEIEEALQDRDEEIAEALDMVRDRVQYTWRSTRRPRGTVAAAGADRGAAQAVSSGAEYLRRAASAAKSAPSASFRAMRSALEPLRVAERHQPATAALPEALYHLVDRAAASRYEAAAVALQERNPRLTVTGPFPPFAFAAEIL